MHMKKILLPIGLSALVLCGCAHQYVIKLSNGTKLVTASKPKLEHGGYTYKDAMGRKNFIPEGRVREIAPLSMAEDEEARFKATTRK
jgi:Bacterial protein of unknown function (DUF903)